MSKDSRFDIDVSPTRASATRRSGSLSWLPKALVAGAFLATVIAVLVFFYVRERRRHSVRIQLLSFAIRYLDYDLAHGHHPSSLDDLGTHEVSDPFGINLPHDDSLALEMVRNGRFVVLWNATRTRSAEDAHYVLGHESDVSERGGFVMLGDGSIHYMSAVDFGQLPHIDTATHLQDGDSSSSAGQNN